MIAIYRIQISSIFQHCCYISTGALRSSLSNVEDLQMMNYFPPTVLFSTNATIEYLFSALSQLSQQMFTRAILLSFCRLYLHILDPRGQHIPGHEKWSTLCWFFVIPFMFHWKGGCSNHPHSFVNKYIAEHNNALKFPQYLPP